jgi:hypothetical protein
MLKKYTKFKMMVPNCLLSRDSSISRTFEEVGLYLPKPSGHYMHRQFNIKQFHVLPTQCIYVFYVDLRTNRYYFPLQH